MRVHVHRTLGNAGPPFWQGVIRLLPLVALVVSTDPARAAIWWIEPDGSGDAPSIQAALDAAAPGDVIRLAPGTFKETLIWPLTQGLTLEGADPDPAATVIDAEWLDGVIAIDVPVDSTTVLRRLTLIHGQPVGT